MRDERARPRTHRERYPGAPHELEWVAWFSLSVLVLLSGLFSLDPLLGALAVVLSVAGPFVALVTARDWKRPLDAKSRAVRTRIALWLSLAMLVFLASPIASTLLGRRFVKAFDAPDGGRAVIESHTAGAWHWLAPRDAEESRRTLISFEPSIEFRIVDAGGDDMLPAFFSFWYPHGATWASRHILYTLGQGREEWDDPASIEWLDGGVRLHSGKGSTLEFEFRSP